MPSFKQNLQKFFVYFFAGVSVIIVVLGISRVKKGDQLATAPAPSPDQGANTGSSQPGTKLAVRGATQTAFNGRTYQTPWGNLAVAIQVKDGKVTAVSVPTLPDSPPSQQAKAQLIEQAIRSGGANIQGVTGATITSLAFKASLESALSQAANAPSAIAEGSVSQTADTTSSAPLPLPTSPASLPKPIAQAPLPAQTPGATAKAGVSGTFTGNAYSTPWGNAVASITVTNGKITGVTMPVVPNSPPSQQAEPYLVQQALSAGSANIQGVSGATYASIAFKSSLESAIAKANGAATAQGQTAVAPAPATASTITTATPTSIPSVSRRNRHHEEEENEWDD